MAIKRKRKKGEAVKLEMTPMIDVVFQLLIFFIVTLKPEDILSHLDISRPAPDSGPPPPTQPDLIKITVYKDADRYVIDGGKYSGAEVAKRLKSIASYSKTTTIIINCTGDSPHGNLVNLLNICAKEGLNNLSVFSI